MLSADSIAGPMPFSAGEADSLSHVSITEALMALPPAAADTLAATAVAEPQPLWQTGLEGTPRTVSIGDNSGVIALVAGMFLLMMMSYKHCRRLFATLGQSLWGMRRRANAFDEHTTNETRTLVLMSLQWCVYVGLLGYSALALFAPWLGMQPAQAFSHTAVLIALAAAYYAAQIVAYNALGFTFSDSAGRRLLLQGFTASQSILGFALIVPALVAIFYPAAAEGAVATGAALYLAARLLFIAKGFRIFYVNFCSLLYFILYLCALEIIPVIAVASIAMKLVTDF